MAGIFGKMGKLGRVLTLCTLGFGVTTVGGCGFLAEEAVEQMHIAKKARAYEFSSDVDATWAEAKVALKEEGYELAGPVRVDETVFCPGPESHQRKEQASFRITKTGWFSHKIEIDILKERLVDGAWKTSRPSQAQMIEWTIVKRRDPDYAKEVEAEAEAKGKKGRQIVKDIDDLLSD